MRLYRHRDEDPDIQDNPLFRATRRILPASDTYADGKLIARVGGRRVVTPLFIVFVTIGGTDILFALDSIPAVTALSLTVIGVVLVVTTVASVIKSRRDSAARAHAGAVIVARPRTAPDKHRSSDD